MLENRRVSRRTFGMRLGSGVLAGFATPMFNTKATVRLSSLSERLQVVAGRVNSMQFWQTGDVAQRAGLPLTGLYHHLWFGNAGQFRAEGTSRTAALVAGWIGEILGTRFHWDRLTGLCDEYFGHPKITCDSPALIIISPGHITTRHAFKQTGFKAVNLPVMPEDVKAFSGSGLQRLCFGGGWRGYSVKFNIPSGFKAPDGRSDVSVVLRERRRQYQEADGTILPVKDFIRQYSSAERGFSPDYQDIVGGGYYPNSEPYRRLLNDRGYTDTTGVVLIRTVHSSFGVPYAQQININFNAGFNRRKLSAAEQNDPEQLLDINTVVRPLDRVFDQYPAHCEVLEKEVLSRL